MFNGSYMGMAFRAFFLAGGLSGCAGGYQKPPVTAGVKSIKASTIPPIRFGKPASPFYGHVGFCNRHPEDCDQRATVPEFINYDQRIDLLKAITFMINKQYAPAEDQEIYGRPEFWAYPKDRADCEDYVVLKRRKLIDEYGLPPSALLIAGVLDHEGRGHAVLVARTNKGAFVLDNLNDEVKPWHETGYKFIKATHPLYARAWLEILPVEQHHVLARK